MFQKGEGKTWLKTASFQKYVSVIEVLGEHILEYLKRPFPAFSTSLVNKSQQVFTKCSIIQVGNGIGQRPA